MPEDSTLNHWNIDTTKSDETPKGMGSWGLRTSTLKFNKALRRNWNDAIKKFGANHDSWDSLTRDEKDWFNDIWWKIRRRHPQPRRFGTFKRTKRRCRNSIRMSTTNNIQSL